MTLLTKPAALFCALLMSDGNCRTSGGYSRWKPLRIWQPQIPRRSNRIAASRRCRISLAFSPVRSKAAQFIMKCASRCQIL